MLRLSEIERAALVGSCLLVAALAAGPAWAADGSAARLPFFAPADQYLPIGAPQAPTVLALLAARATSERNETGQGLLPADTTIDSVRWLGDVAEIRLTIPARPDGWYLSPVDVENLALALGSPFQHDDRFGGTVIRVRVGTDRPYSSLEQLMLPEPSGAARDADLPREVPLPLSVATGTGAAQARGPVTQAARQPVGALTGVTVFAAAGHGWTAGDSAWYLQRPVLLDMNEDHGNIDMLNYFVQYAFNAGAIVVPFRPVGWQPIEIVLDNDDPGVTYTGTWSAGSSSKYYENGVTNSGIVYQWTSADATETATARYTPNITVTGFYPVYCFTIAGANRTIQTYRVKHSGGISELKMDHRLVGSAWIWLGDYHLVAGDENYVEITNQSTEAGAIIADAIRWGDGVGDIVRPGPGTISGYNRDEEASRYWAESELGNNAAGFDSDIWDIPGYDDGSDNVRTSAKWSREANQVPDGGVLVDRWKRVYLEFHTNATNGVARGQICLITDLGATTYQVEYANILSDEVDNDMLIMDDEFEFAWVDRAGATYTSSYGAICTEANGDEFDATIVELAFHDNEQDAKLLRDDRVRSAMARSCVQGITRFLNSLPGSAIPLAFAPDTPRYFRAVDAGGGNVVLSWVAPLSDGARGDPATGYVVYQSNNGYGFGAPIVLGNVLTTTITDVPIGETRYFRVAATNAGGESMPTEVLAVRRPAEGVASVLLVNGFDRLRRQINPVQTFTQPEAYAGLSIERQIWRRSNSFDYVVQHAEALAACDWGFSSCSNEAVADSYLQLGGFDFVVWILGTESTEDLVLSASEQNRLTTFLGQGGGLFISGADLAYDLINQSHGATFAQNTLQIGFQADSAGTYQAVGAAGSILADIAEFGFSVASGAPYDVRTPDVLTARPGAYACLNYVGGTGGVAGVQYIGATYNVVSFGFPFEAIGSASVRAAVMQRVMEFLANFTPPSQFDYNHDGKVDVTDFAIFRFCLRGPGLTYNVGHVCLNEDGDGDRDVDIADFRAMQLDINSPE
ncbi:MAG TPA: hypothetical protein PLP66_03280 [Phycisphaerae bacterium]|nr:hypothetical protein [Phycisphaerae bacterium]